MGVLTKICYFLLFVLIGGLAFYENIWYEWYVLNESGEGDEGQLFGKITKIGEDSFYLDVGSSTLEILSSDMPEVRKARYGETVVHIIYREGDVIEGIDYHNYDYNYLLYVFSLVAFVIFLIIFFGEWKLTLKGFEDA